MDYFDLHCDTALRILDNKQTLRNADGHISLEKAEQLHRYAQVFALFVHDKYHGEAAWRQYQRELTYLKRQIKLNSVDAQICADAESLCAALAEGRRAVILSVENGAVLGGQLSRVEELASDGVRLMTLTWFGENELGCGSGCGGAFKPFGFEVLKECRRVGIIPDISHLSDEGVASVFAADDGCLIASHSDARCVTPHFRNLTNEMIAEIVRRNGLIGINFASGFLNENKEEASIEDVCRHILFYLEQGCGDTLCFGSDFDGAHMPHGINDISNVGQIWERMEKLGVTSDVLQNIFFDNAFRFFERTLRGETR